MDWIAIVLIVIGLLIMGGAAYFLYGHDQEKKTAAARSRASMPQHGTSQSSRQQVPEQNQQTVQQPTARQQHETDIRYRSDARRSVFSAFDDAVESGGKPPVMKPVQPEKTAPKKIQKDDDDEGVFDELEKLDKRKRKK
jgi:hypothetical protein